MDCSAAFSRVDGAIVVVENIYRHVEDGLSPLDAALKGSKEIAVSGHWVRLMRFSPA